MPDCRTWIGIVAITCVVGLTTGALNAEDWPQWRGVDRDAVWRDTGLIEGFPDGGDSLHETLFDQSGVQNKPVQSPLSQ